MWNINIYRNGRVIDQPIYSDVTLTSFLPLWRENPRLVILDVSKDVLLILERSYTMHTAWVCIRA